MMKKNLMRMRKKLLKRKKNKAREERLAKVLRERSEERCEYCGRDGCDPAHIIPREHLKTKYVLENLLYFCRACHNFFDNNVAFRKHIILILIKREKYERLQKIAKGKASVEEYGYTEVA